MRIKLSTTIFLFYFFFFPPQYSPQSDQGTVKARPVSDYGEPPNLQEQIRSAVRDVLAGDFGIPRTPRGMDMPSPGRGRSGKGADDGADFPLHEPTGQRTRKTFDFTRKSLFR